MSRRAAMIALGVAGLVVVAVAAVVIIDGGDDSSDGLSVSSQTVPAAPTDYLSGARARRDSVSDLRPDAGGYCALWRPGAFGGTGVDLGQVSLSNGEILAEKGRFALDRALGGPFASAQEADSAAVGTVTTQIFGYRNYRWLVLDAGGSYYPYVAVLHPDIFFDPEDPEDFEPNPNPPPCLILPEQGRVVAWHAVRHVFVDSSFTRTAPVQYDWSEFGGESTRIVG